MDYVYILISLKDNQRYIGSTNNLEQRFKRHNQGRVKSTTNRRPLKLYAYQVCNNITEAKQLEYKYKRSRGTFEKAIKQGLLKIIGE